MQARVPGFHQKLRCLRWGARGLTGASPASSSAAPFSGGFFGGTRFSGSGISIGAGPSGCSAMPRSIAISISTTATPTPSTDTDTTRAATRTAVLHAGVEQVQGGRQLPGPIAAAACLGHLQPPPAGLALCWHTLDR